MSTSTRSVGTGPQSARATLQLALAALGTIVVLWGLAQFALVFAIMTPSESGFAEGLAIIVFGLYVLVGFVLLAAGLLIPQHEGSGIQFTPRQRKLLAYGVAGPIVGVLGIPIWATFGPPVGAFLSSVLVACLVVLLLSGPLATLLAVGQVLLARLRGD